jgi:hypothetical protein
MTVWIYIDTSKQVGSSRCGMTDWFALTRASMLTDLDTWLPCEAILSHPAARFFPVGLFAPRMGGAQEREVPAPASPRRDRFFDEAQCLR